MQAFSFFIGIDGPALDTLPIEKWLIKAAFALALDQKLIITSCSILYDLLVTISSTTRVGYMISRVSLYDLLIIAYIEFTLPFVLALRCGFIVSS